MKKRAGNLLILLLAFHLVVSNIFLLFGNASPVVKVILNSLLITLACFGGLALAFIKRNRRGEYGEFHIKRVGFLQIVLAFAFGAAIFYALLQFNTAFQLFFEKTGADLTKQGGTIIPDLSQPVNLVISIIAIAIMPAIFEELFFRGVILYSWRDIKKNTALMLTALLFTLTHSTVLSYPSLFILGYFLASITYETKSIIPAIIIHFMNNLLSLLFAAFANLGEEYISNSWENILGHALIAVLAMAICAGIYLLIRKTARKQQAQVFPAETPSDSPEQTFEYLEHIEADEFPRTAVAAAIGVYSLFAIYSFISLYL
ncbi:MAG TPA: CPBP family intramembrane metalloprotease [Clostridiales bacterium]|jgi:membrane protease YdiL (CAAX protease family)|nr:CPBP family intramembrane metalloprotease [Clostridiales bacterium]